MRNPCGKRAVGVLFWRAVDALICWLSIGCAKGKKYFKNTLPNIRRYSGNAIIFGHQLSIKKLRNYEKSNYRAKQNKRI